MIKKIATGVMALSLMGGAMDVVAGDAAAGKAKSAVCAACHGANGKATIPMYPHLAGQNQVYLVNAMKAYKSKQRTGGTAAIMQSQVVALSDQDIENLAAYYSSL